MEEDEWIMYLEQAKFLIDKGYVLDLDMEELAKILENLAKAKIKND